MRRNTVKNAKFCKALLEVIDEAKAGAGAPKGKGNLLYAIAGKVRPGKRAARALVRLGGALTPTRFCSARSTRRTRWCTGPSCART